jgi:hypothetical protein
VAVHERLTIASTTQTHVQSLRTGAAAAAVEFAQRRRKRSLKIESASLAALRACSTLAAIAFPQ